MIGRSFRYLARTKGFTPLAVLFSVLALWAVVSSLRIFPPFALPSPTAVFQAFVLLFGNGYGGHVIEDDIIASLTRIILGFGGAICLGVPIGFLMAHSRLAFRIADPLLQLFRPVPPLAYIPFLIIWFGIGELPKVLLILLGTIPVIIIGTISGVRSMPPSRLAVARMLGASEGQIFLHVVLPSALPEIFTAARVGIGISWTCLVAAELIAADRGLGWLVQYAGEALQVTVVIAGVILIGVLGYGMELAIRLVETRLVPWRGHDET